MKKNKRKVLEISIVIILSIATAIIAFFSMRLGRFASIVIFGLGLVPILIVYFFINNSSGFVMLRLLILQYEGEDQCYILLFQHSLLFVLLKHSGQLI
jgi:hypothetical protein